MDFINSLSPARKKILLAAAIALIIALVIVGFVRLTGSSDTDAGTALTDDTTMTRALTYFQFVKDGETWKLSGFSFPDDPTC